MYTHQSEFKVETRETVTSYVYTPGPNETEMKEITWSFDVTFLTNTGHSLLGKKFVTRVETRLGSLLKLNIWFTLWNKKFHVQVLK